MYTGIKLEWMGAMGCLKIVTAASDHLQTCPKNRLMLPQFEDDWTGFFFNDTATTEIYT